jgi:N-acetylglutamate synthase-like GNAT family acetyltransferase
MISSANRVRRATLDDLGALKPLWTSMRFPVADLEKRLTEFQVVENGEGKLIGAIGFQIAERHGRIHSEAFPDFADAEAVRAAFWERIRNLASNHGVLRLWTQENVPFWKQHGLQPADAETLRKLPPAWQNAEPAWLTLQLKDENVIVNIEKELAMLLQVERDRTARAMERGKALKTFAMLMALALAIFVMGALAYMFMKHPNLLNRPR